ncbi:aminoglycoside phosphotransferase [Actinokineospora iranica]|uniref:Phosphotransferase enzyme family protein n=1 Tax=Actinokineospora iranica TaxID=1271860 RepID=A0A1G6YTJ4_9PSEU|nr:aminoglycoside phosphotransferase [Actinokineospora iranica]SDD93660.1 hypothetical protein SAMN05216174_12340 [Actinokineospora iranica]
MAADDDGQREWMREQLAVAADHFSVKPHGELVYGWRDRTIGSRVSSRGGERWLRVSWADPQWAQGEYWTGNADSTSITGVPKPVVLDRHEWGAENYRNRAEIMTLVIDQPCSATAELRDDIDLPDQWWSDLRNALDTLAHQRTDRGKRDQRQVSTRLLAFFGSGIDPTVTAWVTAHGDLNWSNLTRPGLVLLDWESWGRKMVGYDAATLYVLALRAPDTAKKVHDTFADTLDSPDGLRAQLFVIARYLKRVELGDFSDYADHLHRRARTLLDRL